MWRHFTPKADQSLANKIKPFISPEDPLHDGVLKAIQTLNPSSIQAHHVAEAGESSYAVLQLQNPNGIEAYIKVPELYGLPPLSIEDHSTENHTIDFSNVQEALRALLPESVIKANIWGTGLQINGFAYSEKDRVALYFPDGDIVIIGQTHSLFSPHFKNAKEDALHPLPRWIEPILGETADRRTATSPDPLAPGTGQEPQ